jgi:hypothetical protein
MNIKKEKNLKGIKKNLIKPELPTPISTKQSNFISALIFLFVLFQSDIVKNVTITLM